MHLSKPAYRIFPYRNVAWGWNSVYPLGALSWPFSYTGTCVAWKKTGKTAWNCGLGLHGDRGVFWMDSVQMCIRDSAGGAHHTAFTYDLTAEQMGDWAAAMGIEAVYIDKDTTIRNFKNELRWNEIAFRR